MTENTTQTMSFRPLGDSGLITSVLGLGTVKLGRDKGVKYPEKFTIPDDKSALQLINQARDLGINLIDTAPAYGNSEERLGTLLSGQRQHWLIATKVGEEFDNDTGKSSFNFSPEHIRYSVERSLQRLKTDVLDIVLVHSDGRDADIIQAGALDVLRDLKQAGKLQAYGMSTKTIEGGLLAAEQSDVVMATYNLNETADKEVLDYCLNHNKGCIIKKAFASGHIMQNQQGEEQTLKNDPIQTSLNFVLGHLGVGAAIVGTTNPVHLQHNVTCALQAVLQPTLQAERRSKLQSGKITKQ